MYNDLRAVFTRLTAAVLRQLRAGLPNLLPVRAPDCARVRRVLHHLPYNIRSWRTAW